MSRSVIYGFTASLGIIKGLQLLSKILIAPGMFTDVVNDKLLDKMDNGISYKLLYNKSKRTIIYCHGNAEHIYNKIENIKETDMYRTDPTANFLFFNYRGYGNSKGYISDQESIYKDTKYMYEQITKLIPNGEIIIWGFSLGCYPAVRLCTEHECKHLILHSPFKSIQDVLDNQKVIQNLSKVFSEKYNVGALIDKIKCPIDILHSRTDEIVPYVNSLELAKICNIKGLNYSLHEVSGNHGDNLQDSMIKILKDRLDSK